MSVIVIYLTQQRDTKRNYNTRKPPAMTTAQRATIARIEAQHEAQRFSASQVGRPVLTLREQAQSLAQAMLAAKEAGELDRARALAIELKPLMSYLD